LTAAGRVPAGGTGGALLRDLVALTAHEACEVAGRAGREALAHMSQGDDLRMQLAGLRRFTKPVAMDTASARRRVGQAVVENRGYTITG
jgi:hypothetical protein